MLRSVLRRCAAAAALAGLAAAAAACVSSDRHRTVVLERDALRREATELGVRSRALERRMEALRGDLRALHRTPEGAAAAEEAVLEAGRALEAELASERAAGLVAVETQPEGAEVRLGTALLFEPESVRLSARGRDLLARVGGVLRGSALPVVVAGHTDGLPVGAPLSETWPSHWDLAAARAGRVAAVLETAGVRAERLAAVSRGAAEPLAPNTTAAGRLRNRRIEIRVRPLPPLDPAAVPSRAR